VAKTYKIATIPVTVPVQKVSVEAMKVLERCGSPSSVSNWIPPNLISAAIDTRPAKPYPTAP
jgi:hypothetical protein